MKTLRKMSVTGSMILLVALSYVAVLAFAVPTLLWEVSDLRGSQNDARLARVSLAIGGLTHEMQKERGASAGFLSSNGEAFGDRLAEQRQVTDSAVAEFRAALGGLDVTTVALELQEKFADTEVQLDGLAKLRAGVDGLELAVLEAVGAYTAINKAAIAVLPTMGKNISFADASRAIQRHALLMSAKDLAGLERAAGAAGFSRAGTDGVFPEAVLGRLQGLIRDQSLLFDNYERIASNAVLPYLEALSSGPVHDKVHSMRQVARSGDPDRIRSVSGGDWFDATTKRIDLIKSAEDAGAAEINSLIETHLDELRSALTVSLLGLAAVLVAIAIAGGLIIRSVSKSIKTTVVALDNMTEGNFDFEYEPCSQKDLAKVSKAILEFCDGEGEARAQAKLAEELMARSEEGITRTLEDVGKGDFSSRIRCRDLTGAALILGNGLNSILELTEKVVEEQRTRDRKALAAAKENSVAQNRAVEEVSAVVASCSEGDFSKVLPTEEKDGVWRALAEGINEISMMSHSGLTEIGVVIRALADGDLTRRMSGDFKGQFAEISEGVNAAMDRLTLLVAEISGETRAVKTASSEMRKGFESLAKRSEQQSAIVGRSTEVGETVSKTATTNTENMEKGFALVDQLGRTTKDTEQSADLAVKAIGEIEGASDEITKIVATIDEIAFQTNLLALNASVEAARAGDAGKGFAVVANEVRSLAGRCAEASSQIGQLIKANVESVQKGSEKVRETGDQIKKVRETMEDVRAIIETVAQASATQSGSTRDLSNAMQELAASSTENKRLAEQNRQIMSALAESEKRLDEAMSEFSVDDTSGARPEVSAGDRDAA